MTYISNLHTERTVPSQYEAKLRSQRLHILLSANTGESSNAAAATPGGDLEQNNVSRQIRFSNAITTKYSMCQLYES